MYLYMYKNTLYWLLNYWLAIYIYIYIYIYVYVYIHIYVDKAILRPPLN